MKTKQLGIIIITCLMLSSCSNLYQQQVNNSEIRKSINTLDTWELVDEMFYDIDGDGKDDSIILYWLQGNNIASKLKVAINNMEKVIELDPSKTIAVRSVNLKQFVTLDKNNKGILVKLNCEGEIENQDIKNSPPYWHDHSFLVLGYTKHEIAILLDGINQPYNLKDNYKLKYLGDYSLKFNDNATGFNVEYGVILYKTQEDGENRLQTINKNQTANISINYFDVKAQDINADGKDEIICSKYIPGLYHADLLGIVDYTFTFEQGMYFLSNETLKFDGSIVRQTEIK